MEWSLPFRFPHQNSVCISHFSHTLLYAPSISSSLTLWP
jgi:hypothetical protein